MNHSIGPIMNFAALAAAFGFQPRNARLDTRFSPAVLLHRAAGGALGIARQVLEEDRASTQASRAAGFAPASLEQELSSLLEGFPSVTVRCEISVTGRRRDLKSEIQQQIKLIASEAIGNALRHSGATLIEVEVEYSARRLRLIVRDNGCGIDPQASRVARETHWGLQGMRERAERIGAELTVWSKPGAGTEVEITVA